MFEGKSILVTGGTGSFGRRFVEMTLKQHAPRRLVIFSRDEMKQWEMAKLYRTDPRVRFFLGDVRDKARLERALSDINYVVHAAALKIVPSAEYNPFECIKTNIQGAMNLIECALDARVDRVIALSTDKAVSPVNLYGATKLCSDKLFVSGNAYVGQHDTRFCVVRYGNVMGSRGSVIPLFLSTVKRGELPITDRRMTRFMIPLEESVQMVWHALNHSLGGEVFVRKSPSMKLVDIADAIAPDAKHSIVGIRPGEKLHECLISSEDALSTWEFQDHYVICPQLEFLQSRFAKAQKAVRHWKRARVCQEGFSYSSDNNTQWLTKAALLKWIRENKQTLDYATLQ